MTSGAQIMHTKDLAAQLRYDLAVSGGVVISRNAP